VTSSVQFSSVIFRVYVYQSLSDDVIVRVSSINDDAVFIEVSSVSDDVHYFHLLSSPPHHGTPRQKDQRTGSAII